jgi:hypothetical protein
VLFPLIRPPGTFSPVVRALQATDIPVTIVEAGRVR